MTKIEIQCERNKYAHKVEELETFLKSARDAINLAGTDCENGRIHSYYTGVWGDYIEVVGNLKELIDTRYVKYRIDNVVYSRVEFDKIIRSKKIELKEMQRMYSKYDSMLKTATDNEKMQNADRIQALKVEILNKDIELQRLKTELRNLERSL